MFRKNSQSIKNMLGVGLFALAFSVAPQLTNAEVKISSDITTKQTFTEDVVLESDITIKEGAAIVANGNITIDLNGHSITKEKEGSLSHAYYAIEVKKGSEVKLTNGSVTCSSPTDSCVRNYGVLTIEKVNVKSNFHSVKNEEDSTLTITGSTLEATGAKAASIQNYGTASVSGSKLIANGEHAVAVYNLTYNDFSSKITVTDTTINATKAVETYYDDLGSAKAPTLATTKNEVIIGNGTVIESGKINIREVPNSKGAPADIDVNGEVKAPVEFAAYATNGAVVTVNNDIPAKTEITIPEGAKVVIPADVKVDETAKLEGTVEDNRLADYTKVNEAIKLAKKYDKTLYTEESYKVLEDAIKAVVEGKNIAEQDAVDKMASDIEAAIKALKKVETTTEPGTDEPSGDDTPGKGEVPPTLDNIFSYVSLAAASLGTVGIATKKVLFR